MKKYAKIEDVRIGDKVKETINGGCGVVTKIEGNRVHYQSQIMPSSGFCVYFMLEVIEQASRKPFTYDNAKDLKPPFKFWNDGRTDPMDCFYVSPELYHFKVSTYLGECEWQSNEYLEPPLPELIEVEEKKTPVVRWK